MILDAFETLLDRKPPTWMRKVEASVLMGVFARAFEVDPPATEDLSADQAFEAFQVFTAACMEAALADEQVAAFYRARLGQQAYELGESARRLLAIRPSRAFKVARFLYRGIGIELAGELPGELEFGPCSFAKVYTPRTCWFMSAFDEGFLRGISGCAEGALVFSCRLTEGASLCRATFA